ncbi:MAG: tetratricopeptide repeat protein, partial [Bdellovibrionales bacterium]|nr:tetratricopeptide repeat protein [Bdellovibrionales bacterium]
LDLGRSKEGIAYFKRLAREYPKSKYVHEANVHLGDFYFDNASWAVSADYYKKIISAKYEPLMPYSVYKRAWAQYNLGDHKGSLAGFKWVISHESDSTDSSFLRLKGEAIRDIALPFVELGLLEESIKFYKNAGNPYTRAGLENMARVYQEKGKQGSAIILWKELLKGNPNHEKNPEYDLNIIESYRLANATDKAVSHLFDRLPAYSKNSGWYELNARDPKVVASVRDSFEEMARKMAFESHATAQKLKKAHLYEIAKQLYTKYLEHFDKTTDAPKIRFYLAEILYKNKNYLPAAHHYYQVYEDPHAGKLRADAIEYALTALDRQLNIERKKQGLAAISSKSSTKLTANLEEPLELLPYSNTELAFLKIAQEYLKQFPKTKQAPDILYSDSYLRYVHHEIDPAYEGFWNFIKTYPKHPSAYSAAHLILDILNRRKDYTKLIAAAKQFNQTPGLAMPKFKAEVAAILRQTELKMVQLIEQKGDYKKAAYAYVEYTKAYGAQDPALFEKALYNAAINFTKADMPLQAVETEERFLRRFPKSQYRKTMVLNVAKTYELLAKFDKAAQYFERFALDYPSDPQTKSALRLAGLYWWGSGENERAHKNMLRFIQSYGSAEDQQLIEQDLVSLYESQNALGQLIQLYDRKRNTRGVSWAKYVDYSVKIGDLQNRQQPQAAARTFEAALQIANAHRDSLKQSPEGMEALGKLLFWSVAGYENRFYRIPLNRLANLQNNLQAKIGMLKNLETQYRNVASSGSGEWGIGAMYKTAAAYRHMAQSVLQAPVPSELKAAQLDEYREEVRKTIVNPFQEKALAFAEQCLDKAQELNVFSPYTSRCQSIAAALQPKRYPAVRTFYLPPLHTALMLPDSRESKIERGKIKIYALPLFSTGLFQGERRRNLASESPASVFDPSNGDDNQDVSPKALTYSLLSSLREKALIEDRDGERPGTKQAPSFSYLNLMRLTDPRRAVKLIQEAIEGDPNNEALHNLLGLAQMEKGNLAAAKITWLALTARGVKNPALWNNLGVALSMEGRERDAIEYFQQAILMDKPKEALANLGFIALKYYNGFEAKKYFERALDIGKSDPATRIGHSVALLQNREIEASMEVLPELTKRYRNDPYARLSLAYMLMDVAKERDTASHVLKDYMEKHSAENDPSFRKALSEARDGSALPGLDAERTTTTTELPDIE